MFPNSLVVSHGHGQRTPQFLGWIFAQQPSTTVCRASREGSASQSFKHALIQCRLLKHDERTFVRDRTRHPHVPGHPDFVARHLRAITKATSWAGPFPKHRICVVVAVAALCVNRSNVPTAYSQVMQLGSARQSWQQQCDPLALRSSTCEGFSTHRRGGVKSLTDSDCCVRRLVVARCGGLTFCPKIVIFLFLSCFTQVNPPQKFHGFTCGVFLSRSQSMWADMTVSDSV